MKPIPHIIDQPRNRGFTLMEMIVAISLLVMLIIGVGLIFRHASAAVSLSQANMEMLSNVRAVQFQIEQDLAGLDRNGMLIIRSQPITAASYNASTTYPAGAQVRDSGKTYRALIENSGRPLSNRDYWEETPNRADQLAFTAYGSFPNRTGTTANPLASNATANAALVWIGHGITHADNGTYGAGTGTQATVSNANDFPRTLDNQNRDRDLILCRRAVLLMAATEDTNQITLPDNTTKVWAYPNPARGTTINVDGVATPIAASRVAVAAITPSQLMQQIIASVDANHDNAIDTGKETIIPETYCFRSRVLPSPYASSIGTANGAVRMHPILLQGVSSFAVEWTDGTAGPNDMLQWFGADNPSKDASVELTTAASGDTYTAVFSFHNKTKWPKALRIRYHVTDQNDRLAGGREFVQIIHLPQ